MESVKGRNKEEEEAGMKSIWFVRGGGLLTFDVVRPVTELQGENVVDRSAAVQEVGVLVAADESVLSSQDQHGPVDQLQGELLVLA